MFKVGFKKHFHLSLGAIVIALLSVTTSIAQSIDSTPTTTGTYGSHYIYSIQTSGFGSVPAISVVTDAAWLTLTDHGDGTATLEGDIHGAGDFNAEITATDGVDMKNQPFLIEIEKAVLTVTAENKTKVYGTANPSLTLTYAGFQFTDVVGVLDIAPAAGTTAGTTTDAGSYAISVTEPLDDNYEIVGVNGTLTITKITPTITWSNPAAITYGTALTATQLNASASVPGTYVYNPAIGEVLTAGPHTLSVNFTPTDAVNYESIIGRTVTINVNKATPVVSWTTPADINYGTALSATQLNASANTGGTFTYSPLAGTVLNAGPHTLSVDFAPTDAANYESVIGRTVTINVNKVTPTINWTAPAAITYGTPLSATQLSASSVVAGTFTYTPAAGTVLNAGIGQTLSVDFTPTDAVNYNTVTGFTRTITVNRATPVITWTAPAAINYPTPLSATQLNATANVAGSFVYTPAIGAVLNAGTRTLSVDFTPTDAVNYEPITGRTVSIVVNKINPVVTWNNPADITYGTTLSATQLNATANVAGTFAYTPVSGTTLSAGTRTLSVNFTPTDAVNYNTITGQTVTIIVKKAIPTITWATPSAINYGTALSATQLNASANVAGTFNYTPSLGAILNAGPHSLSADFIPTDAVNYEVVVERTVNITVNKVTPTITWANPAAIVYGTALTATQLSATASVAGTFVYTPAAGAVLNAGAQTLVAEFTPTDITNYNVVSNIQRPLTVNKATPVVSWTTPADITYGTALSATQLNATATVAGTFAYTPVSGTVLNAGSRPLSVNFTPTDAANYNSVTGTTVTIIVLKATPTITWNNPTAITYGTALGATQLNATASVAGSFVYSPAAGAVLSAGANQTLVTNFTPTDAVNYNAVTNVQRTITVNKATPTVTWNTPAAITFGTALSATQLNATASTTGSFVYTPPSGTVLTAGPHALLADFTPTDAANYNAVTGATVNITVNKANPTITWANPTAIVYGTPLSATQLNATANVPGAFVYTPAVGAVLNAGAGQTLSTTFTPTDAANYNTITNFTRTISVTKATPTVTWNNPSAIVYGTPLSATQQNATASVPGTFLYVPGPGTILPTGANQAISVNFTPTDAANYNVVNGTQALITVNKATPTITWNNPADITYGTALSATQLNATSSVPGTFVYSPTAGTILSAGAGQSITASFTPSDPANYNAVAGLSVTINVLKANPIITWSAPAAITYGTALSATQLSATSNVPGVITYTPVAGTVLNAGPNQTLQASFVPTDVANYNTIASVTRQITVNKATPVVSWSNPSSIVYGTPLSATQQNATANVTGAFDYTPAPGTILNVGNSQNISVKFTPTDLANYNIVNTTTVQISVTKATPIITWTPSPVRVLTPLNTTQHLNAVANVPGTFTYNPAAGHFYAVDGTYTLTANFTPTDAVNYNSVTNIQVQIVVSNKDNPEITWNDPAAIVYGTLLSATQLNATANVAGTFAYTPPLNTLMNAGAGQNLAVTFTPTDGTNYNAVSKTVHINVNKKALTATAQNASRAYGVANPTFVINYAGFVGSETSAVIDTPPTATSSAIVGDPAGTTSAITPAGGADDNYSFTYVPGTLTINKAALTAKADNKTRTYGGANPPFTISYTGFANGDDAGDITEPAAATAAIATTNVGNYPITLTGGAATNYTITLQAGTLNITQAPLVATPAAATKVYGTANPAFVINYLGFQNGETAAVITTAPAATSTATNTSPVGNYPVNLSGGVATNYSFLLFPGTLTVTKATLTAKANDKSKAYGAANPAYDITYTGFVGADGPASVTQPVITPPAVNASSNAGTYPIQLSGGSATNYDIVLQNGTLTINKVALTAKAANKTRVYGAADPAFTITYTGFVNGDDATVVTAPTASTTATAASFAGVYPINLTGGSATNYTLTLQSGTLTITPAGLTAKAVDKSRAYGQPNPAFTINYTGFVNGDNAADITEPTAATAAVVTSPVGNYPITLSGGASANYTITLQSGNLNITKAALTAKANDITKVYGTANPAATISYTGFVNGDDASDITPPTITGPAANASSPAGIYPITLSGGSGVNYTFSLLQSGSLTITKAPLTARADDKTRLYGGANPTFTISYTGFVLGQTETNITKPVASTTAVATSNVGTYDITLSGTTTNYEFTFEDGTLTVNKAPLTTTANNLSKVYGAVIPTLTLSYVGFVNGETATVLDTAPAPTTTATSASPVGTYPITLPGITDNNYNVTTNAGTLTVTKASLIAKANNQSKLFGAANPALTISYTGFVNGDTPASITQPTASTTATTTSQFGSYPITLAAPATPPANYTLTLQQGILTVAASQVTITVKNTTRAYGAADPVYEYTYSGFTNGQTAADLDVPPTVISDATPSSSPGEYTITPANAFDPNYAFLYIPGKLTITKGTLTATPEAVSSTYGTIPAFGVTYTGFANGENASVVDTPPTATTSATVTSSPGAYIVTLTGGSDNNYTIVNNTGSLTITKKTLTVKADNLNKIIGMANPILTATYSGFVNGDGPSVINQPPTLTTTAVVSSPAGLYPITVSGGSDDNYDFDYETGTLTVIFDNPPVAKNFSLEVNEDTSLELTLAVFEANRTDDPNGKIVYIKVVTVPQNGSLFRGQTRLNAGDEVNVVNNQLPDFRYVPNSNYSGTDAFTWNLFDGAFASANNATVSIKVVAVNDPPVLSNIESLPILYSPGDAPVTITGSIIINDVDNNFVFSAIVAVASNFSKGDLLAIDGIGDTKILATYDANKGELKLDGKETRGAYESALRRVKFSSPVNGEATLSDKSITMVVRDSVSNSNVASRTVTITETLPELDLVSAFTPNGDGVNDVWDILNLESYTDIKISIYNQDGLKVFSCTSKDCAWDGLLKGQPLPPGPYPYIIDLNQGKRRYKGTVTILK